MKMVCKRESLLSACQLASTAVPSKDVKPVLRNLKAIVDEKFCTLMATDLELGIRLEVRGIETNEPGDALFPASRLISILRESPAEELTIDAGMDATIITAAYGIDRISRWRRRRIRLRFPTSRRSAPRRSTPR